MDLNMMPVCYRFNSPINGDTLSYLWVKMSIYALHLIQRYKSHGPPDDGVADFLVQSPMP